MAFPDAYREAKYQLTHSAEKAQHGDWLGAIGHAVWLKSYADAMLRFSVAEAREAGDSWQEIGDELGISRQAAHERFADARTDVG